MSNTLPPLNENGDLPLGFHLATWTDIQERFGGGTKARVRAFEKLKLLHKLAMLTGKVNRFLVFGSFVSNTAEPRDIDLVLVMDASFKIEECPRESRTLFNHADAEAKFGVSVFWLRERELSGESLTEFFAVWQTRRDGKKRGLLEVLDDSK